MPSILPPPEPRTPREEMEAYLELLIARGRAVRLPDGKVKALPQRDWPRDCAPADQSSQARRSQERAS